MIITFHWLDFFNERGISLSRLLDDVVYVSLSQGLQSLIPDWDSCFWWFRASDKKRNLAQQKAEAQRRLYGHGSVKKLSASSSDREKQRHTLERRREELVNHTQPTQKYLIVSM